MFSKPEQKLVDLLEKHGTMNTTDLIKRFYGRSEQPVNARAIIHHKLGVIDRKLKAAKDKRRVRKSARRGPRPIEVWLG